MKISEILELKGTDVKSVGSDGTVKDALDALRENDIGALVVTEASGEMAGLVSERDIVRAISLQGADVLDAPVSDLMNATVPTCAPPDMIRQVLALMTEKRERHIPVVENGALCGIVSIGDAVKYRLDETMKEADVLRSILGTVGPG